MNDVKHEFCPEDVMALVDGELSQQRAAALAVHLESCSECTATVAKFRDLSKQLVNWQVEEVPARLAAPVASTQTQSSTKPLFSLKKYRPRRRYSALIWALGIAGAAVLLFAVATPNLLRSRMAANEASSVGSLRTINTAADIYAKTYGHYPPSLRSLGPSPDGHPSENAAGLIDSTLADGETSGYRFSYQTVPAGGQNSPGSYTIDASPMQAGSSGQRHFSTDQTGVLSADNVPLDTPQYYVRRIPFPTKGRVQRGAGDYNGSLVPNPSEPMIARTVSLSIVAEKDFDGARASLDKILARHNGYAASLNVSTPQGAARSLQASLRIPAPHLAAALGELKALGHVENETQNGEEVTQQHADLVARLKNSRETEQRLQAILVQRTGKISDVLAVEQQIARVRGEIEQMEGEQKALEHRVDFATIDLKLSEEYKAKLDSPAPSASTQLHNASVNGYRNVVDTLLALLLFFAEYGPVLLLWAMILFTPAWFVWRRWRRAAA